MTSYLSDLRKGCQCPGMLIKLFPNYLKSREMGSSGKFWRALSMMAAFASAAFCSALVGASIVGGHTSLPIALVITSMLTLMIGLPAYLGLRSRLPATWWSALMVGYLIGAAPITLLSLMFLPDFASSGDVITVQNAVRTIAGWIQIIIYSFAGGLPGAVGGLAFWSVLKITGELRRDGKPPNRGWLSVPVMSLLLIGVGVAFALPSITMDRSCHNGARDGRSSVTPRLVAKLDIGPTEWPAVQLAMKEFSDSHAWSFRESLGGDVERYAALQVSVCKEPGIAITALQHYANPSAFPRRSLNEPGPRNWEMIITVTQEQSSEAWRAPSRAFFDELEARYGDRLTFTNSTGQVISREMADSSLYRPE